MSKRSESYFKIACHRPRIDAKSSTCAREHRYWNIKQCRAALFTDEYRTCQHGSNRKGWVKWRPYERFEQCCFAQTASDILLEPVVLYVGFISELPVNNARCRTSRITRHFLEEVRIRTMDWWGLIQIQYLTSRKHLRISDGMPQDVTKKLVRSMKNGLHHQANHIKLSSELEEVTTNIELIKISLFFQVFYFNLNNKFP